MGGVARIFFGVHFFLEKSWRPFLLIALKTLAKTAKLTISTLEISPAQQKKMPGVHFQHCL